MRHLSTESGKQWTYAFHLQIFTSYVFAFICKY